MPETTSTPQVGDQIGPYRLLRKIAQGGFASVWEAREEGSDVPRAIKFMLPDRLGDAAIVKRFQREAQLLAKLDHPNIVQVLDHGVFTPEREGAQAVPYLVMELLDGHTLEGLLQDINGPIAMDKAVGLLLPVLDALSEAHRWGIIHRDLKPDNIFIQAHGDGDGVIKLLDFGICKPLESSPLLSNGDRLTKTDQVFGTPDYMAPEQIAAEPLSPATDVYAIGILLYELLLGERPFVSANAVKMMMMHLDDPMPPLPAPYSTHPIAEIVARATAKEPRQRYATARALKEALEGLPPFEAIDLDVLRPRRAPGASTARVPRTPATHILGKHGGMDAGDLASLPTLDAPKPPGVGSQTRPERQPPETSDERPAPARSVWWTVGFAVLVALLTLAAMLWITRG